MKRKTCQKCKIDTAVAHCPICNMNLCGGCAAAHLKITSFSPDAIEQTIMNHVLENMSDEERVQLVSECKEELEKRLAPLFGKKPRKNTWKDFIEEQGGTHRLS